MLPGDKVAVCGVPPAPPVLLLAVVPKTSLPVLAVLTPSAG